MSGERVSPTLHRLIKTLWTGGGSDLLLTTDGPPYMRRDGKLRAVPGESPLRIEDIDDILDVVLLPEHKEQFVHHFDVDFSVGWEGVARLRGSAFRQRGLPSIALRIIPDRIPGFDELAMPRAVRDLGRLNQGLVLFTGPTGSGKSTSQASLIDWINRNRECHILTIEDPIEYVHRNISSVVSQREIGSDTMSFERALRSALREDPDVLLVGEMRDLESIAMALTLAETGHLVFSTLHTNDAAQAIDRIVDVFPAERQDQIRTQLAGSLAAVVAQRLVPRMDDGMTAAYEVLLASHAVRNLIREGKSRQLRNVMTTSIGDGMQTLEMGLSELVEQGFVSYDEAVAHAFVPKEVTSPSMSLTVSTAVASVASAAPAPAVTSTSRFRGGKR
ncbi:MAG: type IV pilus twitching motility protein PilT [Acidimicrobiia bacterium]